SGGRPLKLCQPVMNDGTGGALPPPCRAPPSTHATMVSTSRSVRLRLLASSRPNRGSANHGGISRLATRVLIARAHGRASSYVVSAIGAASPARWHTMHLL